MDNVKATFSNVDVEDAAMEHIISTLELPGINQLIPRSKLRVIGSVLTYVLATYVDTPEQQDKILDEFCNAAKVVMKDFQKDQEKDNG